MPSQVDPRVPPDLLPDGSKPTIVAEHQVQYTPLPAIVTPEGQVITRWEFTAEERKAIFLGEDLYITLLSKGQISPFLPSVGPLDWKGKEGH